MSLISAESISLDSTFKDSLIGSREEGSLGVQLGHDAAQRPEVGRVGIGRAPKQHLHETLHLRHSLIGSRGEGSLGVQLSHDAAHRPHIDRAGICRAS